MIIGAAVIIGFYCLGELIQSLTQWPIPGSILGMLLLLCFLLVAKKSTPSLHNSSDVFITNLPLLLIPSSTGIITCIALLEKQGLAIVITLVITILCSLISTAWILNFISKRMKTELKHNESKTNS